MINEFHGLSEIYFNPTSSSSGLSSSVVITGDTWLVNWGINPNTHPHLLTDSAAALVAFSVGFVCLTYAALALSLRASK
jgi:hypothetical protein